MLSIVILLWILAQFVALIAAGFLDSDFDGDFGPLDGAMVIAGSLCSFPLVALLLYMRRPKLEHLIIAEPTPCLLYTSPSPRDVEESRMPSSA